MWGSGIEKWLALRRSLLGADLTPHERGERPAGVQPDERPRSGHQLNFFCFLFVKTPHRGDTTILFRSSQQLPRLRLGPLKDFLS